MSEHINTAKTSPGQQLDSLGLAAAVPDGHHIVQATVTLVTAESEDSGHEIHRPVNLPYSPPGSVPVPHPHVRCSRLVTDADQALLPEQRQRVAAWLTSNGIDPSKVATGHPVSVEYKTDGEREWGHLICFAEYYQDSTGSRTFDYRTRGATVVQRCVRQSVALEPEADA